MDRNDVDWIETKLQNLVYSFSEKELVPKVGAIIELRSVRRLIALNRGELLLLGNQIEHPQIATVQT